MASKETETIIGTYYTRSISKDDRGRIVAEVWHNESGKTVGITECDTVEMAVHWATSLIAGRYGNEPDELPSTAPRGDAR